MLLIEGLLLKLFYYTLFLNDSTLDKYLVTPLGSLALFILFIGLLIFNLTWEFFKSWTTAIYFYWISFSNLFPFSLSVILIFYFLSF
jgi:hypothetical protein